MLVTSWIDGIKINDLDSLRSEKYDIETITKNSAEAFFLQVFRDGFFHILEFYIDILLFYVLKILLNSKTLINYLNKK